MKTFDQFIQDWNGKKCEVGGSSNALYQCVDLANAYITEVLGLPAIFWTNAQDFPSKAGDKYDYILNTPAGIPERGDLVIFKSADGVGHISVFIDGNATKFNSFDQNFPTGSVCKIVSHGYTNVLGWLHPKTGNIYRGYDLTNQDSMKVTVDDHMRVVEGQLIDKQQYESIKGQLLEVQKQNDDMSNEMGSLRAEIKALTGVVESKTQAIDLLSKEDVVQLETLKREEARADKSSDKYFNVIVTIREQLKLSSSIEDESVAESEIYSALGSLIQTNESYETQVKELESQVKKLSVYKQPVAKLTTKQMFAVILEKLLGVSNK